MTTTRDRILKTTARLLQRQGYHGTGLNQIVAEAEAPKGSMYFHFPGGKEQLAAEALAFSADRLVTRLGDRYQSSALEALDTYIADAAEALERSDFAAGCPVATVALERGAASAMVGDACTAALDRLTEVVAGWFEAEGADRDSARARAFIVYAALEGALLFAKARRSIEPLTELRAQLPRLLAL